MANEIHVTWPSAAATLYAIVRKLSDATVWDVAAATWDTWADADIADYDIPLTDLGGDLYAADFPAAVADGTEVRIHYYEQAGAAPAITDTTIGHETQYWLGGALTPTPPTSGLVLLARAQQAPQLASVDADLLAHLIAAASTAIEQHCRRTFLSQTFTEVYDGDGTQELLLDQFPVASLTTVTITDSDGTEYDIDVDQFRIREADGLIKFRPDADADFTSFPDDFQNVEIVYVAGYTDIPEDVQEACILTVAWMVAHDKLDQALASERLGDYSWTAKGDLAASLPTPVRALLAPYVNHRIA